MNKIVEEQLKKVVIADLSNFDYNTNTYHIKQYTKPKYDIGGCYLVRLPGEIIKNPNTLLAINWNHGTAPQHEYMKIYVSKALGKMVQVDGLAFDMINKQDLSIMWSGWLNTEELTQIAKI